MLDFNELDLRKFIQSHQLTLSPDIDGLRDQQIEALEWATTRTEPYLFVNAPTGSGKTLLAGVYGMTRNKPWTYGVHTIRLQEQVAGTFTNLPVLTGRRNHPCLVGEQIYGVSGEEYNADRGICAITRGMCNHEPRSDGGGYEHETIRGLCDYYAQVRDAMAASSRVTNYAMFLSLPPLQLATSTLLADEGHNIEEAVASNASVSLFIRTLARFRITVPNLGVDVAAWGRWAEATRHLLPATRPGERPDFGLKSARDGLTIIAGLTADDAGAWLVEQSATNVVFTPIWGRNFVMKNLFGHTEAPASSDVYEATNARQGGVQKVLLLSATLMGAEYIADTLGFPDGSWAYLDLPSTFPIANRPINYSPVVSLSAKSTEEDYDRMQVAIDHLIEYYICNGSTSGIIHAVSNKYRDRILTSSRFRGIMRDNPAQHEEAVRRGEGSVLVAANLAEGWDGKDDLCRFVIMPKVPFPNLGDKRTKIRMQEDARSFDHKALVAVVQGAGRGVRHKGDYADTWILDGNWQGLYARRKDWLPESFTSAYHHKVQLV